MEPNDRHQRNLAVADRYAARAVATCAALGMLFEMEGDAEPFRVRGLAEPAPADTGSDADLLRDLAVRVADLIIESLERRGHFARMVAWGDEPASGGWSYISFPSVPVLLDFVSCGPRGRTPLHLEIEVDLAIRSHLETHDDAPWPSLSTEAAALNVSLQQHVS